jgi:ankyrin repeat protein
MKPLPARPSLESLRKQAKKLTRDAAAGDAGAIARVRAQLPGVALPLTQRNAQLVIAREYGYAGWQDLTADVSKRLGNDLEWAAASAHRAIHDNDVDRLKQLLSEYSALLSWQGDNDHGGLLGFATGAYGDAGDPERERWFTRPVSAELLIDAGAVVTPSVCDGIIQSRAKGLLELFRRKGLLPRTLKFSSALGDLDAVRETLDGNANDLAIVNEALITACRFGHEAVALVLLDRSISLDPELGGHIDGSLGRVTFIETLIEKTPLDRATATTMLGPWELFAMGQIRRALDEGNLTTFVRAIQPDSWLLADEHVDFQRRLIEDAAVKGRKEFVVALFDLHPAILRRQPPPPSQAIEHAMTYGNTNLIPLLTRIWPLPDDLPHAAGLGNLPRVKHWLAESGAPTSQQVLDTALAYSVINHHFDVADVLLAHGANINTNWNSHEPASILHTLVFEDDYEAMQFLIDRGIDMTIKDYRWDSTARGWALFGKKDEKMAAWLEEAERHRAQH